MSRINKQKTILEYFRKESSLGVSLDQTQTENVRKSYSAQVVRRACFQAMIKILEYDEKYGITFTFKKSFHGDNPLFLHRLIDQKIASSRLWKECKYILYPEFTAGGILHYHGLIYDCSQLQMSRINIWWKRTYGTITKIEYSIRYAYCGTEHECTQINKSNAKSCWLHYVSKDSGKTGLWIIYNL